MVRQPIDPAIKSAADKATALPEDGLISSGNKQLADSAKTTLGKSFFPASSRVASWLPSRSHSECYRRGRKYQGSLPFHLPLPFA